jgi:hypothetical protein
VTTRHRETIPHGLWLPEGIGIAVEDIESGWSASDASEWDRGDADPVRDIRAAYQYQEQRAGQYPPPLSERTKRLMRSYGYEVD